MKCPPPTTAMQERTEEAKARRCGGLGMVCRASSSKSCSVAVVEGLWLAGWLACRAWFRPGDAARAGGRFSCHAPCFRPPACRGVCSFRFSKKLPGRPLVWNPHSRAWRSQGNEIGQNMARGHSDRRACKMPNAQPRSRESYHVLTANRPFWLVFQAAVYALPPFAEPEGWCDDYLGLLHREHSRWYGHQATIGINVQPNPSTRRTLHSQPRPQSDYRVCLRRSPTRFSVWSKVSLIGVTTGMGACSSWRSRSCAESSPSAPSAASSSWK